MRQLSSSGCSSRQACITLQPIQHAPLNVLVAGGSLLKDAMQAWQASNAQAGPTGVVAVQCPESYRKQ